MGMVNKRLCAGTLTNVSATLYTAPATSGLITIIKSLTLCNITNTAATATIKFDSIDILNEHSLDGNDTLTISPVDQIIEASELISGFSGTNAAITYYISGKEVS